MGLLKFGLCVITWVLCASEKSADNTGLTSSELECVEGQDLSSAEPCTKCICTQGKTICIDVDCDLEKKENATRSGPSRNSIYEKIRPPENISNGPRHSLVDIINKQPITNGLPHLSSVYTKERNVIKMGKPTPNISMILTETHVENVLKTFLTRNHNNDDQYVLIVPEVSQENKYPDKRDTSLADTWEHKYNNKFQGQPSQTVSSEAFKNAPFPTYDSERPYGVLFNENKQRYSSSIILDDQSSVPLARKPLVFGRPGDNRLLMRPRHFMRNEDFANQQNKNKQFYPYLDNINHNVRSWFDPPTADEIKSAVKTAVKSAVTSAVKSKTQEMVESLARQKGFNFDFSTQFNNPFSSYPLTNEDIPNIHFHTPDQPFPFSQNKYNYPNQPIIDNYNNINGNSAILYDGDQEQMLGNDQYNIYTMPPNANLPIYNNKLFAPNLDSYKQLSSNLPDISYSFKKQLFVPLPAPIQDPIKYQRPDNRYPEQFYNKQYTPPNNQPKKQCSNTSATPCRNQMAPDKISPYNSKKNASPLPSSQPYRPLQIFQPWSMNKPIEFLKPLYVSPYIQPKQHNKPDNYPNSNLPQGTPSDQINKDNAKPRLPNATPYKALQSLVNNNYADYKKDALHSNTLLPSQDPAYGQVASKNPTSNKLQIPNGTKLKPSQVWPVTKTNMFNNELIPDNAVDNTELAPVRENRSEHKTSFPAKLFNNIPKFFGNIFHKSPHVVAPSYHDDVPPQQNNIPNDKNPEMEPNGLEPSIQNNIPQAPNNIIDDKPNDFAPDKKEHTSNNNEVPLEYSNMPDYQSHQMKPNEQEQFIPSNDGQLPYEDTRPNGNNIETEGHSNIPDYGNHKAKPNEQEPSHLNNIAQLPNNMFDDETSNNDLPPDKNEDVPVNTNNIVPQEYNNKTPHEGFSVTPNPIQKHPDLLPFMPFNGNDVLFPNQVTKGFNYPDLPMNKPANKPKEPKTFGQGGPQMLDNESQTYPNNNMPLLYYMPYMPKIPFSYIPPILVDEPKMYPEYNSLLPYYPLMNKQPFNPQIINNDPKIYENMKPVSDHHPNIYKKHTIKIPQTFKKPSKTYPKDKLSPFKFYPHKQEKPINHWPSIVYNEPEILSDYENIPQDYPLIHEKPNESPISSPKEPELYPDNKNIPMFNHYHPHQYKETPQIGNNIPTIYTKPRPKPTFHSYPHEPKQLDNPSPFNNELETNEYENIPILDKEPLTFIKEPNIYPIVKPSPVLNYYQDRPKELTNHRPQIFYDEPENLPNHKNIPIFNDYPLIPEPEMYPESKSSPIYNLPHTAYESAVNNPQLDYNDEPELYSDDEYIPVFNHHPQQYEKQPQYTPKKDKKPKITPKPILNFYPHKKSVDQSPVIVNDKPEMYPDYEYIPLPDSNPQTNKYLVSERPQTFDKAPDMYPEVKRPVFQFVPHIPKEPVNKIPQILYDETDTLPDYENIPILNDYPLAFKNPIYNMPLNFNPMPILYPKSPVSDNSQMVNKPSEIYPKLENIPIDNFYPHKPQEPTSLASPIFYDEPEIYPDNSSKPSELYPNINKKPFNDYPQLFEEAPQMQPKGKKIPKFNDYPQKPKKPFYQIPQKINEIPQTFPDYINVPPSQNYPQMPIKASASPNPYNKVPKLQPTMKPSSLFKYYPHRPIKPINHTPQTLNDEPQIYPDNNNSNPFEPYPDVDKKPTINYPQTYPKYKQRPIIKPKKSVNKIPQILYDEIDMLPDYENIPILNDYPLAFKNPIYNMPPNFNPMPILYPKSPVSDNSQMVNKPYEIYPKLENIPIDNFYPHKPQEPANLASPIFYDEPVIYPDNSSKPFELFPNINKKPFNDYPQLFEEVPQMQPKGKNIPKFNDYPQKPKKPVYQIPQKINEVPQTFPDYINVPPSQNYPQMPIKASASPNPYNKVPKLQPTMKPSSLFKYYPHRPIKPINHTPQTLNDEPQIYPDNNNSNPFEPYPDVDKKPTINYPQTYPKYKRRPIIKPKKPVNKIPQILYDETDILPDYENIPILNDYPLAFKNPIYNMPPNFNPMPILYPKSPVSDNSQMVNKPSEIYPKLENIPIDNFYSHTPQEPANLASPIFYDEPEIYPDNNSKPSELYPNINKKPFNDYPQPFKEAPQMQPKVKNIPKFNNYPQKSKKPVYQIPQKINEIPQTFPDYINVPPSQNYPQMPIKASASPNPYNKVPKLQPTMKPSSLFKYYPHRPIKPINHTPQTLNDEPQIYPDNSNSNPFEPYPNVDKKPTIKYPQTYPKYKQIPVIKPKKPVNKIPQILYDETDILPDYENIPIDNLNPHTPQEPANLASPIFYDEPQIYPDNSSKPSELYPNINKKPFNDYPQPLKEVPQMQPKGKNIPKFNDYPQKPKKPVYQIPQKIHEIPQTFPDYINVPPSQNYPQTPIKASASPNPYNKVPKLQPTMESSPLFKYYPDRPIKPINHTPQTLNHEPQIYPDNNNSNPFEPYTDVDKKPTIKYPQTYPKYKQIPVIKPKKPVKLKPVSKGVPPILPISAGLKPYIDAPKLQPKPKQSPTFNFYPYKPDIPSIYPNYENIPLPDNILVKPKNLVTNKPQTYYNMPELQPTVKPNPIFKYYPHRPKEPTIYTPDILNNKPKNYPDNDIKPSEHIPKIDNKPFYNNPPIFNEIPKIYPEVTKSPMPNYYPYKPKELIKPIPQTFPYIPDIYPDYENTPLFANSPVKPKIPMKKRPQAYNNIPILQPTFKSSPIFKYYPHRPAEPKRPIILNNAPGNLPDYKEKVNPIVIPKPFTYVPDLNPSNDHIPIFNYFPPKHPSQELNKQSQVYSKINPSPIFNNNPQKPKEPENFNPEIFNDEEKLYPDNDIIPIFDDNLYPSIFEEPTYANLPILNHAPEIYPKDKHKPITSSYPYIPEYTLTKDNPQTYNEAPNMKPKVTERPIYKGYPHIPNQPVNYSPQNPVPYKVVTPVPTPVALQNTHELLSPKEIKEFCRICKMLHCCPTTPLPNSEHPICFDANTDEPHFQYFRPFDSDIHQYPQVSDYSGKGYIPFGWHNPDIQSDVGNDMPYLITPFYDNLVDVVPITSDLQKRDIMFSDEINGILPIIAELHKTNKLYDKELGMILSPFDYFDPSNSMKYHDLPVKSEIPNPEITQSKPDIYELGNNKNDLTDEPTKYNLNKPDGSEAYNQKLESNFDSFIHFDHTGDKDGVDSEKNIWQSTELISKQPQVTGSIIGNTAKESVKPKKQSQSSTDYSDFDNLPTYIDTKVRNSDPIRPKRYLVQRDSSKVIEDNSINVPSVFNSIGKAMKYMRQSIKC